MESLSSLLKIQINDCKLNRVFKQMKQNEQMIRRETRGLHLLYHLKSA